MSSISPATIRAADFARPSSRRRDHLNGIEVAVQKLWESQKVYETDEGRAMTALSDSSQKKFFCSFPYPYMNGRLHLGHAFTITKAEFQARFQRLLGKNVLWPFAFHCTGMPISACSDKLKREIEAMHDLVDLSTSFRDEETECKETGKFSGKKSKAVAKAGVQKTQWEIIASCGVPENLIPEFQDPQHWLQYFPQLAKEDLQRFGLATDWRRSFITTERNQYYDAFVRWQFNTLKNRGYIKFGTRPSIFSKVDDQPCTDHDRALGEGVNPQEQTLIKMNVRQIPQKWLDRSSQFKNRKVYLVAATLRPETMYGQTNCYVLPGGEYQCFVAFDKPIDSRSNGVLRKPLESIEEALSFSSTLFICSYRSANNMAYQGIIPVHAQDREPFSLLSFSGEELIGLPVIAPNSTYPTVYVLPMLGISMEKGIVTSVPSDSPDDYAALRDLQTKPALREKFNVTAAMVDMPIVEIIDIPGIGRKAAVDICAIKNIKSQNDKALLAAAKEELYKKGFYEGIMLVGNQKGKKVSDAKPLIRAEMIESGDALSYLEPERKVVSRTGDECIVALCDQWYIDYGNESWTKDIMKYVGDRQQFNAYSERTLHQFQHVIPWLREWACSRHYGLGTYIPWVKDSKILIESLSDSTVYMAYYTIAHFLQGDLSGDKPGQLNIKADELTDEIFDYIFGQRCDIPQGSISEKNLKMMRGEFNYWYPLDLRVSGKDLIFNHLTMSLFNHAAIWPMQPGTKWPKSFFCNGHVMVDAEKMSKSTGNFLSLQEAMEEFTADGTRLGLADAGDSMDDANFQRESANAALMRLFLLDQFVDEFLSGGILSRDGAYTWADYAFENHIVGLTEKARVAYERLAYRDALKAAFFDFNTARDYYRNLCGPEKMHRMSVQFWISTQAVILSPIAPHISEHIWSIKLKMSGLVIDQKWPRFADKNKFDVVLDRQLDALSVSIEEFRKVRDKSMKGKITTLSSFDSGVIYVAKAYLPWQQTALKLLQKLQLDDAGRAPADASYMTLIKNDPDVAKLDKKLAKEVLSFASFRVKEDLASRGREALELDLPFNELLLMQTCKNFLQRSLGLKYLDVRWCTDEKHPMDSTDRFEVLNDEISPPRQNLAVPLKPAIVFWSNTD